MGKFIFNTIMFIVNFVFFLVGAALMSFGIVLLANPSLLLNALENITGYQDINYVIDLNSLLTASGILMTVVGSVIMAISLIGLMTCCCGGSCLYIVYASFLGLIIAFEVSAIIYLSLNYTNLQIDVQQYMLSALNENFQPVTVQSNGAIIYSPNNSASAWQMMQFKHGCCGAYGYSDYLNNSEWKKSPNYVANSLYPPSCCMQITQYQLPDNTNELVQYSGCITSTATPPEYVNTKGCYLLAMDAIYQYGYITNIIIASLIALEVIILQLTVHQCYNAKLDENKVGFS